MTGEMNGVQDSARESAIDPDRHSAMHPARHGQVPGEKHRWLCRGRRCQKHGRMHRRRPLQTGSGRAGEMPGEMYSGEHSAGHLGGASPYGDGGMRFLGQGFAGPGLKSRGASSFDGADTPRQASGPLMPGVAVLLRRVSGRGAARSRGWLAVRVTAPTLEVRPWASPLQTRSRWFG